MKIAFLLIFDCLKFQIYEKSEINRLLKQLINVVISDSLLTCENVIRSFVFNRLIAFDNRIIIDFWGVLW